MRCIVINLERAVERRRFMTEQFGALGLDFEILTGTDWKDLSDADDALVDRESRTREGRSHLSPGMVACWLSHKKALKSIAGGDDAMAAVIEDDAQLEPDIKRIFSAIEKIEGGGNAFDVVFLNQMGKRTVIRRFIPLMMLSAPYRLGMFRYSGRCAQGYVITKAAAAKVLDFYPKIIHQFDHSLHSYWLHGLRVLCVDPPVVSHACLLMSDEKSFLRDAPSPKRQRTFISVMRRGKSAAIEAARMAYMFGKLKREIKKQLDKLGLR